MQPYLKHKTAAKVRISPAVTLVRLAYQVLAETIWVECQGTQEALTQITIDTRQGKLAKQGMNKPKGAFAVEVKKALDAYFVHPRAGLDLPLMPPATSSSQQAAMAYLRSIPCGQTRSYAQQAAAVRRRCTNKFTARNAGNANHANRFPLAIPCHRVVRSDGSLGGFMGTDKGDCIRLKQALLTFEQQALAST